MLALARTALAVALVDDLSLDDLVVVLRAGTAVGGLGLRGLLLGVALGSSIWATARISAARDPQFVSFMLVAAKLRQRYDAGRTQ